MVPRAAAAVAAEADKKPAEAVPDRAVPEKPDSSDKFTHTMARDKDKVVDALQKPVQVWCLISAHRKRENGRRTRSVQPERTAANMKVRSDELNLTLHVAVCSRQHRYNCSKLKSLAAMSSGRSCWLRFPAGDSPSADLAHKRYPLIEKIARIFEKSSKNHVFLIF